MHSRQCGLSIWEQALPQKTFVCCGHAVSTASLPQLTSRGHSTIRMFQWRHTVQCVIKRFEDAGSLLVHQGLETRDCCSYSKVGVLICFQSLSITASSLPWSWPFDLPEASCNCTQTSNIWFSSEPLFFFSQCTIVIFFLYHQCA